MAINTAPVIAVLPSLGGGLVLAAVGVWVVALLAVRHLSRRMLAPITSLANQAAHLDADDPRQRLPVPRTGDELESLAQALNALLTRQQESLERQRSFTSAAAHQLRTPLAIMLGQLEVALRRPRPASEYPQVLAEYQRQANRLQRIVEALLFLAQPDRDACQPQCEPLQLDLLLRSRLAVSKDREMNSTVKLELAPHPCWVQANSELLGELLDILLDNARKYRVAATEIEVRLSATETRATLAVENACAPAKTGELDRLFDPFYRADSARLLGVPGSGLGLSIASRLASSLRAQLTVRQTAADRICFTVEFPLAPAPGVTDPPGLQFMATA